MHRTPSQPTAFLALAALSLGACGGGSGGSGVGGSADTTPDLAAARARAILEGCVLEGVEAFETVAARFDGTLDGEASPVPDFELTGFDLLAAEATWTLDAEPDGQVDLFGTLALTNAAGQPTLPFTLETIAALLAGTADLPALLGTLPDGTHVLVEYATASSPAPVSGGFDAVFEGGAASTVSGSADFDATGCDASLRFEDLPAAALYAPQPAGVFDVLATSAEGVLEGTVTLEGDGTATIDVTLDGGARLVWDYDLETGALTLRP